MLLRHGLRHREAETLLPRLLNWWDRECEALLRLLHLHGRLLRHREAVSLLTRSGLLTRGLGDRLRRHREAEILLTRRRLLNLWNRKGEALLAHGLGLLLRNGRRLLRHRKREARARLTISRLLLSLRYR